MIEKLLKSQNGLTILETLISTSLMLFTIVFVVTTGAISGFKTNAQTEDMMIATETLKDNMEYITTLEFGSIKSTYPEGYEEIIDLLENKSGKWVVNYPDTGYPELLCIKLTAYWLDKNGMEHSIELITNKS